VFGLFGAQDYPKFPSEPSRRGRGSGIGLSVGDLIDADGELQQRITEVRTGTRGSGDSRHTILFISTERVVDGGFASEGPAHILLRNGVNVKVTRGGRHVQPNVEGGYGPASTHADGTETMERKPPRYAKLTPVQAAMNLGLSSLESLKALMECTVGIREDGFGDIKKGKDGGRAKKKFFVLKFEFSG
jgi:hypothetical protein